MHYLIRAKISRKMKERRAQEGHYHEHTKIWKLMRQSDDQQRDFLFRWDEEYVWVLGANPPNESEGFEQVEYKPFSPKLTRGQLLEFQIRVNPVIRIRDKGQKKKADAVMHLKKKDIELYTQKKTDRRKTQDELVKEACTRWIASKKGFSVRQETLRFDAYQQVRFRGKKSMRFSSVEISGVLEVNDITEFEKVLFDGIGSAKGFGCGLMLVKPFR